MDDVCTDSAFGCPLNDLAPQLTLHFQRLLTFTAMDVCYFKWTRGALLSSYHFFVLKQW
jgi:hypothetical protein